MSDLISRQAAIDALSCENPTEMYIYYDDAVKAIRRLPSAEPEKRTNKRTETHECDLISRKDAIDALWKALYEYEDKTEKQFQDSDELNLSDWILHRIFVQNMSDIDRQTILQLPSAEPEMIREIRKWINSSNRGNADYFIVDKIEEIINKYE